MKVSFKKSLKDEFYVNVKTLIKTRADEYLKLSI